MKVPHAMEMTFDEPDTEKYIVQDQQKLVIKAATFPKLIEKVTAPDSCAHSKLQYSLSISSQPLVRIPFDLSDHLPSRHSSSICCPTIWFSSRRSSWSDSIAVCSRSPIPSDQCHMSQFCFSPRVLPHFFSCINLYRTWIEKFWYDFSRDLNQLNPLIIAFASVRFHAMNFSLRIECREKVSKDGKTSCWAHWEIGTKESYRGGKKSESLCHPSSFFYFTRSVGWKFAYFD